MASDAAAMEITAEQFARIEHCRPTQRGDVSKNNLDVLNAILYVAEHGCKWRRLPCQSSTLVYRRGLLTACQSTIWL